MAKAKKTKETPETSSAPPADGGKGETPKGVCPVSKEEFLQHAQPFTIQVGGTSLVATPKEFSTGSYGYFVNDRIDVIINGKKAKMMCVLNLPLVYSGRGAKKD